MQRVESTSTCPRCGQAFHCGATDGPPCWCTQVALDAATRAALSERYRGCLCSVCLAQLQAQRETTSS